jgi:cell division protein FtsN
MIIHEVTQEVQTISEDSYALQLGAFRKKANADALRRKLEKSLGLPLQIVVSDGFYKVRLPEMKDKSDVDRMIDAIGRKGISEIWLISQKAATQQWVITERQDTVTQIRQFVPDTTAALTPYLSIQVGAFRRQANALALRDQLAGIGKKVEIVREDGLYKVRITGFTSYDEMERLIPTLGLKDVWRLPIQLPAEGAVLERALEIRKDSVLVDTTGKPIPVIELPDTARLEIPVIAIPDTAVMKVEIAVDVDTAMLEIEPERERDVPVEDQQAALIGPAFSLHAAVFNKEAQAQRAVNKIQSKLNLPAVIIQQWDFYHVVIPGFYTREETYKYYPELAGMGFTEVYIIEKK